MTGGVSREERAAILEGLESADEEVRRLSVEQLLLLPADEAAARLCESLGDPGWRVRKAAVARLVRRRHDPKVQAMLVASLADGDNPGRRNAAFEALVACGSGVTPRLVGEMTSDDVDVRKLVVDALAAIGDPESRAPLGSALADPDANVRAAAAEALGVVGGVDEIGSLLDLVTAQDEDVLVRLSALRALSRMEASVGVASLGDALEQSLLRPACFELLGFSADPEAIETLIKGLASGSRSSREGAMGALLRTLSRFDADEHDRLIERLRAAAAANERLVELGCERLVQADLGSRMVLIQFLGLLADTRAIVPILESGRDEAVEELADRTLESFGRVLPEALEPTWSDLPFDLKTRACAVLGRVRGEVAERLLADALAEGDPGLRCIAATALGQGGFFDRMPELVRRLEGAAREAEVDGEDEVDVVVRAIVALAEHPEAITAGVDAQLVGMLSSRLAGAPEPVRLAIAKVLAKVGQDEDEEIIGFLLKDAAPTVRRAAVQALERFDFERARDALRVALVDESSAVRIAAATVLGRSDRDEAAEDLARQMGDEDERVVAVALRSVGRLHRGRGLSSGRLEDLIGPALDREPLVALAALEALIEVGGESAARLALSAIQRPEADVVRAVVACAGAHGDERSLAELLPSVAHADWAVRAEVVQMVSDRAYRKGLPALLRRLEVEDDAFVREAILRAVGRLEE
ncbi:MAG: HEAT repeat domain-containing protein [bacterium]|nr:HEAT repeat domain-containing protein [bacterium]